MKNSKTKNDSKSTPKRRKLPIFITVLVVLIAIFGSVYAVYGNNINYSVATPKQKFMIGLNNSITKLTDTAKKGNEVVQGNALQHFSAEKSSEIECTLKFGADTDIFDATPYDFFENYALNFNSKNDITNDRATYDLKLLKNDADLLTGQFYGDNTILALKIKELYPKFITANNSGLIQTFANLGFQGFPFNNIDISQLQPTMSTELKTKLTTLSTYFATTFMDQLDSSTLQKTVENRTISGISVSGDSIVLEVNGTQFVAALKATINLAKDNTEIKNLIKDIYNNYLMDELGSTVLMTDTDINSFFNDFYSFITTNETQIAGFVTKIKIELFIVDAISVRSNVQISLNIEGELIDINVNIDEENAQYNLDSSIVLTEPSIAGTKKLNIELTGYMKNIEEIPQYQAAADDVKLESVTQTQLSAMLGTVGENFDNLVKNDPLLTLIMSFFTTSQTFADVSEESIPWAYNEIESLANMGIVQGKMVNGQMMFMPKAKITRAEAVTMVVNSFYFDGKGSDASFKDVSKNAWYYKAVGIAYKNGLIKGLTKTTFGPNKPMKRQDLCVMIVRAMIADDEISLIPTNKINETLYMYSDQGKISSYAKRYVATAVREGIIMGTMTKKGDMKLLPRTNATRAQAAVMAYRMFFGDGGGYYSGNEGYNFSFQTLKNKFNPEKIASAFEKSLSGNKSVSKLKKGFSSLTQNK